MASSGGRPSDPIRTFFLKIDGTKMRCIDCNTYVSDKIERLRTHRKRFNSVTITHQELEPEVDCELNQIAQPEPESNKKPKTCQSQMSSYCVKTDSATSNQIDLQIARFFLRM